MSEQLFHRRTFLNDEKGAAMIEATVEDCSWIDRHNGNGERRPSLDGTIHITDCSRSIELCFSFSKADEVRDALRKLDRLIDTVQGVRDALVRAAKREFPGKKF